jgi:prepilin-type N-terminal cleavage/methylation domain-containing protein
MKTKSSGVRCGRRFAFTLIELLVVIAIIGILTALLLPALAGAKRRAILAQCQNNFHQISVACFAYANDYSDYYPVCTEQLSMLNQLDEARDAEWFWLAGIGNPYQIITPNTPIPAPRPLPLGSYDCLGYLYETKMIGNGKCCFCPSYTLPSQQGADYYSDPVFPSTGKQSGAGPYFIQDTTLFNPRIRDALNAVSDRAFPKTSSTWSEPGSGGCHLFAIDFLFPPDKSYSSFSPSFFAHYPAQGFNVLFIDGSVNYVQSPSAFFMVSQGEIPLQYLAYPSANRQFDNFYNDLENAK